MGVWRSEDTVITDAGFSLLAGLTGKKELKIKRAVAGADYTNATELSKLTEISHVKKEMGFGGFEDEGGMAILDVYIDNAGVEEEFYHQQIGIYAEGLDGKEVLFLVAQATSPDLIATSDIPIYITHRIFLKYSAYPDVEISISFSGVVTREMLEAELAKKENLITKRTAFNLDFCEDKDQIRGAAKAAEAGGLDAVARADHVHPIGSALRFAQNAWGGGWVNLIPDTDTWVMSSGKSPDDFGNYAFEATFQQAWEGFSCFFDADTLESVKGKTVEFGVSSLIGAGARLEFILDGTVAGYILQTEGAASMKVEVPDGVAEATLRIIIFSADDLHCRFEGLYMKDADAGTDSDSEEAVLYMEMRKVKRENLPSNAVPGTFYLTEDGGMYFGRDDGSYLPVGGSRAL